MQPCNGYCLLPQESHCAKHKPMDSLQSLQISPMLFFILVSLSVSIIVLIPMRKKLPYPPGPRGYPIIGNMGMMDQLTHRGLARLSRQYGGLCHLQMRGLHVVVVSTPEIAREVLQVQDIVFANRPANVAIVYLTYDRADLGCANYGSFWCQMRKVCVMKLFSRKRAESWASVRDEVEFIIRQVLKKTGEPVNIGELVFALTRSITYKAAFGSSPNEGARRVCVNFARIFKAFWSL